MILGLTAEEQRPNILVIMSDDQGYADVSINPNHPPEVSTPNIDALAKSGVIMTNGYTTGHVCSPTRLGMMTGRYQQRYGTYSAGQCGSGIAPENKLIANYMQDAGYTNGAFGKWHMGLTEEHNPVKRGFDEFFGFMGRGAHDYFDLANTKDPIFRGLTPIEEKGYLTNRLTEEAIKFMEKHNGKPWFCYLPYNAVHSPQQAPEEDIKRYNTGNKDRDILMAMLYHLDKGVGEIVEMLKKTGQYENTIIFYLSDNGGSAVMDANNAPFRGSKQFDYEGGVHVPFYVSWPAKIKAGTSCDVPVFSMDILPTACALGGVEIPKNHGLDGKDFMPAIMGKTDKLRDYFFWNDSAGKWAVRSHDGWKLVGIKGQTEMFNLNEDISESKNLLGKYPEKQQKLQKAYDTWIDQMGEPQSGYKRWTPELGAKTSKKKKKKKK
jgi:arylsulfatase A-like enzyme